LDELVQKDAEIQL